MLISMEEKIFFNTERQCCMYKITNNNSVSTGPIREKDVPVLFLKKSNHLRFACMVSLFRFFSIRANKSNQEKRKRPKIKNVHVRQYHNPNFQKCGISQAISTKAVCCRQLIKAMHNAFAQQCVLATWLITHEIIRFHVIKFQPHP